jgi:hypothetical protein
VYTVAELKRIPTEFELNTNGMHVFQDSCIPTISVHSSKFQQSLANSYKIALHSNEFKRIHPFEPRAKLPLHLTEAS